MNTRTSAGYTLIELIVAVGLFAFVMTLVSSAYFVVIGIDSQAKGIATGIDNVSFALEAMSRNMRTGTGYDCGLPGGATDCWPVGEDTFSFLDSRGRAVTYEHSLCSGNGCIVQTMEGVSSVLTDPSVDITSLRFVAVGTTPGDDQQPYVTILVSGTVSTGSGGKTESFSLETSATMRGTDL